MTILTEADVRLYVQGAASTDDILRAIAVVGHLQTIDLPECRAFNAALIAAAISQARTPAPNPEPVGETHGGTDERQLLHRALHRGLRLPR